MSDIEDPVFSHELADRITSISGTIGTPSITANTFASGSISEVRDIRSRLEEVVQTSPSGTYISNEAIASARIPTSRGYSLSDLTTRTIDSELLNYATSVSRLTNLEARITRNGDFMVWENPVTTDTESSYYTYPIPSFFNQPFRLKNLNVLMKKSRENKKDRDYKKLISDFKKLWEE